MWCPKCGSKNEDDALFCHNCGYKLAGLLDEASEDTKIDETSGDTKRIDTDEFDFEKYANEGIANEEREREKEAMRRERKRREARMAARREAQERQKRKVIMTGIIIAVVIAVVGIAAFFMVNKYMGGNDQNESSKTEQVKLTPTATPTPTETPTPTPTETPTPTPTETPVVPTIDPNESAVASVVEASDVSTDGYELVTISSITASSEIEQDGIDNGATAAIDGDEITSWQEGKDGDGIGEALLINLSRNYDIRYIKFKLGNWRSAERYSQNNRPKELTVLIGDEVFNAEFPDGQTEYCLALSKDVSANLVSVAIQSVYSGDEWDDTCISEISIYGK